RMRRVRTRWLLVGAAAVCACSRHAWPGYLALTALCGLAASDREMRDDERALFGFSGALFVATMLLHAVFFGAGRYGLVVIPFLAALDFIPRGGPRVSVPIDARGSSRAHAA